MPFRIRLRRRWRQRGRKGEDRRPLPAKPAGINTLDRVPVGSSAQVRSLEGRGWVVRRLAEMGFVPGTVVRVIRHAPFADPIEYELRGYLVSLRQEEAALIRVKILNGRPDIPSQEPGSSSNSPGVDNHEPSK